MLTAINMIFALSLAIVLSDVMSWTVDLADVNTLLDQQLHEFADDENNDSISNDNVIYSSNYAENFGYHPYNTKQADLVITSGSIYLDGLSKALAIYRNILDNCTRNSTQSTENSKCEAAEKNRDHVERLSEIALITTNKFRDDAVKTDKDGDEEETNLMQLAWALDRLAFLTGYDIKKERVIEKNEDDGSQGVTDYNYSITSTEASIASKSTQFQELEILEQVENGPAVSMSPLHLSKDEFKRKLNTFGGLNENDFSTSNLTYKSSPEIDLFRESNKTKIRNQIKSLSPNIPLESKADVKSIQKRDANEIMKYYVKYKVWNGSNAVDDDKIEGNNFDVENSLKVLPIRKRSVKNKKAYNMRSILHKIRQLQSKLKYNSKQPIRKLIKSIKVYRKKILKNTKY